MRAQMRPDTSAPLGQMRQPGSGTASGEGLAIVRLRSERHDAILQAVAQRGTVTARDLAGTLNVSPMTMRRDLADLQAMGLIERVRGGARRRLPHGPEPPLLQRQGDQAEAKRGIGRAAANLVDQGDVIALEAGSTTLEVAYAIATRNWSQLTVLTNSLPIAQVLVAVVNCRLVLLGGVVDRNELATFGSVTDESLAGFRVNKLFIGCRGIDAEAGVTSDIDAEREIATARAMVAVAGQVIVVADGGKFGRRYMSQVIDATRIDAIVTDAAAPGDALAGFNKHGTRLVVA